MFLPPKSSFGFWLVLAAMLQPCRAEPEGYIGAKACGTCHAKQYAAQSKSNHAETLHSGRETARFDFLPNVTVPETAQSGGAQYRFSKRDGLSVLVTSGDKTQEIPIHWVLGSNHQGLTFLSRLSNERYLENRLSYYRVLGRVDITAGQSRSPSNTFAEALGLPVAPADAFRCLRCHSTYVARDAAGGPNFETVVPGVTCERCHGPGAEHVAAVRAGAKTLRIRNPGKLPGDELLVVCGECHRTEPPPGNDFEDPIVARFQPVGLQMSACFQASNARMQCLTCHDAHANARRDDDAFYEQRCLACHSQTSGKVCKMNRAAGCIGCHMPKLSPLPHVRFTDHWIRVRAAAGGN